LLPGAPAVQWCCFFVSSTVSHVSENITTTIVTIRTHWMIPLNYIVSLK
jgi:hypothetical protein